MRPVRKAWLSGRRPAGPATRAGALAVVVAAACTGVAAFGSGAPRVEMDAGSGGVWVASSAPGQLALLDGPTATVAVRLPVAVPGNELLAAQNDSSAYVVDRTAGTITRVDAATWEVGQPLMVLPGSTNGLSVATGGDALYAVDAELGVVVRADPRTLRPRGDVQSLPARPASGPAAVLDDDGALWVLDGSNGDLLRLDGTLRVAVRAAADPEEGRLVLAAGRPVVVDLDSRTATQYDADGRARAAACVVGPDDPTVQVAGSSSRPEVYTVSGADGVLRVSDLATGDCRAAVAGVAAPGSRLGAPAELDGRVFVPDESTGRVVVVDLTTLDVHVTTDAVVDPGRPFELTSKDGFVFYNDAHSERAGVLRSDGTVSAIEKYEPDDPGRGVDELGGGTDPIPPPAPPPGPAPGPDPPVPAPPRPAPRPPSPPDVATPGPDDRERPVPVPPPRPDPRPQPGPAPVPDPDPGPGAPEIPAGTVELRVEVRGEGGGQVRISVRDGGSSTCPPDCTLTLPVGHVVTLDAVETGTGRFVEWSNVSCPAARCVVTVGPRATASDQPGVNTVVGTFRAPPAEALPAFTIGGTLEYTERPGRGPKAWNQLALGLTPGTDGYRWTAVPNVPWLSMNARSGDYRAAPQMIWAVDVTWEHDHPEMEFVPDGTYANAVTVTLFGPDGVAVEEHELPATVNQVPTVATFTCEPYETMVMNEPWPGVRLIAHVPDAHQQSVTVSGQVGIGAGQPLEFRLIEPKVWTAEVVASPSSQPSYVRITAQDSNDESVPVELSPEQISGCW